MEAASCKICGKEVGKNALGVHLRTHDITQQEYYLKYDGATNGSCKMCGDGTKWLGVVRGWKKYCNKCSRKIKPSCSEYWIYEHNLSEEEAKIKVKEHQRRSSPRCIEYYLDKGYTKSEAKKLISNEQRRDKQWFLNQYEDGEKRWEEYRERQAFTNTEEYLGTEKYQELNKQKSERNNIDYYIGKHGLEAGRKKWAERYGYNSYEEFDKYAFKKEYFGLFYNKDYRQLILESQKYKCGNPKCLHKHGGKYQFQLHHIDYNKLNNDRSNLIFLCVSCHGKSNFDRPMWEEYYNIENEIIINEEKS